MTTSSDGRTYQENNFGDWYLYEADSRSAPDPANNSELRSSILSGVLTAQLVGQEDFAGLPANHFVFNETNTASFSSYTPENPSPTVEGDFYLAQDGNYVLYAHSKESSPGRVYEVTESLSFIGLVNPITLPDDMAPMAQALDVGVSLASLLTARLRTVQHGALLERDRRGLLRVHNDSEEERRDAGVLSNDATHQRLERAHIGHISVHQEPTNCEIRNECVILQNGGEQVVVSFAGTITLEYDHEHVFSPL